MMPTPTTHTDEELRISVTNDVNAAAQEQVNAAYTGQTTPIDTAKYVDNIMLLFKSHREEYAEELVKEALEPLTTHGAGCKTYEAWNAQRAWHVSDTGERTYIGTDPIDCFDYLCDCGAIKAIERLAQLSPKDPNPKDGEAS